MSKLFTTKNKSLVVYNNNQAFTFVFRLTVKIGQKYLLVHLTP